MGRTSDGDTDQWMQLAAISPVRRTCQRSGHEGDIGQDLSPVCIIYPFFAEYPRPPHRICTSPAPPNIFRLQVRAAALRGLGDNGWYAHWLIILIFALQAALT